MLDLKKKKGKLLLYKQLDESIVNYISTALDNISNIIYVAEMSHILHICEKSVSNVGN